MISYSYLVTNTRQRPLAGPVTVADDKATVTCPALSTVGNHDSFLDPGEAVTCTRQLHDHAGRPEQRLGHQHRQGERGRDRLERGHGDRHRRPAADVSLDKSASPATYDAVGDVISYSYLVTQHAATSASPARSRWLTTRRRSAART